MPITCSFNLARTLFFFFKQKTAYDIGLGIPAEPLFRSIVQLHFSKLFLILKSGVNHTSRGSISTSTLPSIKLRKCSSKIITSILSFISGRLATKSNQIKQLIKERILVIILLLHFLSLML